MNNNINDWVKINTYPEDGDFLGLRTHSRYVENIGIGIDKKIHFKLNDTEFQKLNDEGRVLKKLDIVKFTLDSLKTEQKFSKQDEDYLPLSISWVWIKGYYSLFHLICLLVSLLKSDSKYSLNREYSSHSKILSIINQLLREKKPFSLNFLNMTYTGKELSIFRSTSHENLRNVLSFNENLYKLTLRKIYNDECKTGLKGLRGNIRKKNLDKINTKIFSIFDLFIYYRERFNYAGFHYIENDENFYRKEELKKFYYSSYSIIKSLIHSITDFLSDTTKDNLKNKLFEIKGLYEPV